MAKQRQRETKQGEAVNLNEQEGDNVAQLADDVLNDSFTTPVARRKAISRARQVVPRSEEKYAEVVAALVQNVTPRKRRSLTKRGIQFASQNGQQILSVVRKTCESLGRKNKRLFTSRLAHVLTDSQFGLKSKTSKSSHVLQAIGVDNELIFNTLRISI